MIDITIPGKDKMNHPIMTTHIITRFGELIHVAGTQDEVIATINNRPQERFVMLYLVKPALEGKLVVSPVLMNLDLIMLVGDAHLMDLDPQPSIAPAMPTLGDNLDLDIVQ